jgi:hypothetical protein
LKSPDGAFAIRPVATRTEHPDGRREDRVGIVVVGDGSELPAPTVDFAPGRSELFWGPHGSGFAVFHCREADRDSYKALDLREVQWLRFESEDEDSVPRRDEGPSPPGPPSRS